MHARMSGESEGAEGRRVHALMHVRMSGESEGAEGRRVHALMHVRMSGESEGAQGRRVHSWGSIKRPLPFEEAEQLRQLSGVPAPLTACHQFQRQNPRSLYAPLRGLSSSSGRTLDPCAHLSGA